MRIVFIRRGGHPERSRRVLAFVSVLFLLFSSLTTNAKEFYHVFEKANQHYKERNFSGAIELYDSIVHMGFVSPEVFFNLGNAFFKTGNLAPAILNYERAKKLDPGNEDVEFNLKIANLRVADKIEPVPELFFVRWAKNFVIRQSSDGWARLGIILMWAAFICGLAFVFIDRVVVKRLSFLIGIVAFVFSLTFATIAYSQYNYQRKSKEGIVFVTNAYIKSAPDPESADLFILREGVKLKLLNTEGDWRRIKLADGKVGWMLKEQVEKI